MDDTATPHPAVPPAAPRRRQARLAQAEAARQGGLRGYPPAASALMDEYFRDRLEEIGAQSPGLFSTPFALIAVGGYGRGELCPASDVDVLLLYAESIPKDADELSRGIFHPLWDLGLDLGHGVRAIPDCLRLAREDTQVLTSLLDVRRIAGDEGIVSRLMAEFSDKVLKGRAGVFGQWVLEHNAARRAEYGDSSGLLEPDLKNGLGGLRDVHQIHWLMRVDPALKDGPAAPFRPEDLRILTSDYRFVLAARTALHLAAGRKTDRLNFDLQPQVARSMGFAGAEPNPGDPAESDAAASGQEAQSPKGGAQAGIDAALDTGLAVETFLSRLHQAMTRIRSMRQACWMEAFPPKDEGCALPQVSSPEIFCGPTGMALREPAAAAKDPALILELYVSAARAARPLSFAALRATRAALADVKRREAFATLPGILPALIEIFRASGQPTESSPPAALPKKPEPGGLAKVIKRFFAPAPVPGEQQNAPAPDTAPAVATALQSMLDTGLMSALVPEFAPVEHLVQFDDFHIHPVGKHTLEVVRALAAMLPQSGADQGEDGISPELLRIAAALPHFDRLLLAGFCHDLTKPDRDHSGSGAHLATRILRRLGADDATCADVAFLVKQHLTIPKIATRRDLADESVAAGMAELCGTAERLDMLHLLAIADSRSTGPRAWNPWTASLFDELGRKARKLLTEGPLAAPHAVDKSRHVREEAQKLALKPGPNSEAPLDAATAEAWLSRMPARAFLVLDAATVDRHLRLARRFKEALDEDRVRKPAGKAGVGVVEIDAVKARGRTFQVSIAALDQPGLFAVMAGVLALHDLNILSAEVLTWAGGSGGPTGSGQNLALDVFLVQEPADGLYLEDLWDRVRRAVSYALTGKLSLEYRLEQKRSSPLSVPSRAPKSRCKVRVDNEASDFYTLLEVAAPDRLGLLHDLARTICANGLRVHLARISTSAGRIHDVFYVRSDEGLKLGDTAQAEAVKKALLAAAR